MDKLVNLITENPEYVTIVSRDEMKDSEYGKKSRYSVFRKEDGQEGCYYVKQGTDAWMKDVKDGQRVIVHKDEYNGRPYPRFYMVGDVSAPPMPQKTEEVVKEVFEGKKSDMPF